MLAIGIDPGTRNLGWGVVRRSGNRLQHVAHGVLRFSGELSLSARLCLIERGLLELFEAHQPDVGSVESIFFSKDAQAAAKLGHARGVILLSLAKTGVPVFEYPPARVKRTLTGNGQAEKRQVAAMVKALLALEELPAADAADALAIAITHLRLGALSELSGNSAQTLMVPMQQRARKRQAQAKLKQLVEAARDARAARP